MFWGVVLESGKRYSQKVSESYHLSMACLEALPGSTKPAKKEVRVMVEHGGTEFILCVLEYGRVMQEKLDIVFDCGEIVTYFLKGEGVVHLTGYALSETKDENEAVSGCTLLPALKLSNEDDDEEEEDEDWTPSKAEEEDSDTSDDSDESQDEESESESEPEPELIKKDDEMDQDKLIEANEDDTDDNRGKRKKIGGKAPKSKKRKINEASPTQNGDLNGEEAKNEKRKKIEVNHVNAEEDSEDASDSEAGESQDDDDDDEIDDDDSIDDSSEEEPEISSAGRTPMPNRRVTDASSLGESPALPPAQKTAPQKQKNKLKAQDVSSTNKGTVPVTPKNARKLSGNVQVEDLRIGKGPQVKAGKLVFFHYIGKFQSGKTFEKCESPEQPFSFRMGKGEVIKGLDVGLQGMNVGGKRKITIPPHMGYGSKGVEGIPPNSTLVFTVELKAVK